MSVSDLVPTSLSPDPDGGTIPFYTQTVGASGSPARGASALGATLAYGTTRLDYEHANRWSLDVGVRYGVTGAVTVALATRSFSRFAASDAAQDFSAGIDYRVWRGPLWRGGGAAPGPRPFRVTWARGLTPHHPGRARVPPRGPLFPQLPLLGGGGLNRGRLRVLGGGR